LLVKSNAFRRNFEVAPEAGEGDGGEMILEDDRRLIGALADVLLGCGQFGSQLLVGIAHVRDTHKSA
jgi:hypothetical protein